MCRERGRPPVDQIREHTAQGRGHHGRHHHHHGKLGDEPRRPLRTEAIPHHCSGQHHAHGAPSGLQHPGPDQAIKRRRQGAGHGAQREEHKPTEHHRAPPVAIGQGPINEGRNCHSNEGQA